MNTTHEITFTELHTFTVTVTDCRTTEEAEEAARAAIMNGERDDMDEQSLDVSELTCLEARAVEQNNEARSHHD